jgi:hypothetical protein
VLRVVAGESLLVVVVGTVLALGVSVLSLAGQWAALRQLSSEAPIVIPWGPVIGITLACGLIALVSSLLPSCSLRRGVRVRAGRLPLTGQQCRLQPRQSHHQREYRDRGQDHHEDHRRPPFRRRPH